MKEQELQKSNCLKIQQELYLFEYFQMMMESCICGNQIYNLCINQSCPSQSAQFCDNRRCAAYIRHGKCSRNLLPQYVEMEAEIQLNEKDYISKINLMVNELAEELKQNITQKVQRKYYQKLRNMINMLKRDGRRVRDRRRLTSRQVKEVIEEVENIVDTKQLFAKSLSEFGIVLTDYRNKIFEQRQRHLERMIEESSSEQPLNPQLESQENNSPLEENPIQYANSEDNRPPIRPSFPINLQNEQRLLQNCEIQDSKIGFLTQDDKDFIIKSFTQKKLTNLNKIFTASARENIVLINGDVKYSAAKLYEKCGSIKNTLAVVKYRYKHSDKPFLFGGFTPLLWGNGQKHQNDPSRLSRLFWFDQKIVFPLKNIQAESNKAIYPDKNFGFTFGTDLFIRSTGQITKAVVIGNQYSKEKLSSEQMIALENCQIKIRENKGKIEDYQIYQLEFEQEVNEP